jgi:hypothetical protein
MTTPDPSPVPESTPKPTGSDGPSCAVAAGSASGKYDPLDSLEKEVERFMQTNLFTPMEVTGFYIQARCVISELKQARKENEYLRKVRDRQSAIIRRQEETINEYEEKWIDENV